MAFLMQNQICFAPLYEVPAECVWDQLVRVSDSLVLWALTVYLVVKPLLKNVGVWDAGAA